MAIQVACPSCQSMVHVDDTLAGKEILCPNCKERVTVPSIAAGRPEPRPGGGGEGEEQFEEHDRPRRGRGGDMPRWGDDDYDLPDRRDRSRWNATLTGLALIFWAWAIMTVMVVIFQVAALAMGTQPFMMGANPGGAQPPPALVLFGVLSMVLGCSMIVLLILAFVGLCMCCTVPSESGAKGRVVAVLILAILTFVVGLVLMFAMFFSLRNMAMQGAGPVPGQMPISSNALIAITALSFLDVALISTLWLMFHKAIADYFHNTSLSRMCVWYLVVWLSVQVISNALNFISNPMFQGGNILIAPSPMMYVAQVFQMISFAGMMIWYLLLVRETRRTIQQDEPGGESEPDVAEDR